MLHDWHRLNDTERETIRRGIRDGGVHGGPYHVEFSLTDACNYECFFCSTAFVDRSKRLPWDLVRSTMEDLIAGGLKSVRLAGGGEPLIYPQIGPFLSMLGENGIGLSNLTTNAFRLTPAVTDQILEIDTSEIILSFNDIDARRYAETNGTTERAFDVTLGNIRHLVAERARRAGDPPAKRPAIILQFFLWKGNHTEIARAYELGLELGVDHIYLRDMHGIAPERKMTAEERAVARREVEGLMARDGGSGRLLLNFGVEKILGEGSENHWPRPEAAPVVTPKSRTEFCYIGWYSSFIGGGGNVYPCCYLASLEGYRPLGNILERPFREVWLGEAYRAYRDELRRIALDDGRVPASAHCHTRDFCARTDSCPFVTSMAGPEFYDEVHADLVRMRRAPAQVIRRATERINNRIGRHTGLHIGRRPSRPPAGRS